MLQIRRSVNAVLAPRILLSPQVLIGALLLLVGVVTLIRVLPSERPELRQVNEDLAQPNATTQTVDLTLFEADESGQSVERPVSVEVALPSSTNERLETILSTLRDQALGTLWSEALPSPTVFAVSTDNGSRQVAVLNFTLEEPVTVSVDQERQLLASIKTTLLRNGVDAVQVLVNGREGSSFLGHIALDSVFE